MRKDARRGTGVAGAAAWVSAADASGGEHTKPKLMSLSIL
jgi:hypothetical protein